MLRWSLGSKGFLPLLPSWSPTIHLRGTRHEQACHLDIKVHRPTNGNDYGLADRRTLTVRIAVSFRSHRTGKQIIMPDGASEWSAHRADAALVRAIVRAHHWRTLIESGTYASAAELARAEKIDGSYVSRLLRLTLLAPDIVEAILNGKQPRELAA